MSSITMRNDFSLEPVGATFSDFMAGTDGIIVVRDFDGVHAGVNNGLIFQQHIGWPNNKLDPASRVEVIHEFLAGRPGLIFQLKVWQGQIWQTFSASLKPDHNIEMYGTWFNPRPADGKTWWPERRVDFTTPAHSGWLNLSMIHDLDKMTADFAGQNIAFDIPTKAEFGKITTVQMIWGQVPVKSSERTIVN